MGVKISDLDSLTSATKSDLDLIPIVDVSTNQTKKITVADLIAPDSLLNADNRLMQYGMIPSAAISGSEVTFPEAFADNTYCFIPFGQSPTGDVVICTIGTVGGGTKTPSSIYVYPADDATIVWWQAIGTKP